MIEPVAYLNKYNDKSTNITRYKPSYNAALVSSKKLYTVEQLHPRVKMTQAEFDEFCLLYKKLSNSAVTGIINTIKYNESREFGNLNSLFFKVGGDFKILSLFDKFDIDNPEETIEIVPTMKWFVRSKELNLENNYYYFVGKRPDDYWPTYGYKRAAKHFDTKEEAEKWKNPLTEAVQLPVEDE